MTATTYAVFLKVRTILAEKQSFPNAFFSKYGVKAKIPCLYRGAVKHMGYISPKVFRHALPNVPQMAELSCILGVFVLPPLYNKGKGL
jgi:hypothetical protein